MLLRWDKNGEKKGHDMAAMTWSKLVHAQVHIGIYYFFEFNHDIDYAVHAMTWSVFQYWDRINTKGSPATSFLLICASERRQVMASTVVLGCGP